MAGRRAARVGGQAAKHTCGNLPAVSLDESIETGLKNSFPTREHLPFHDCSLPLRLLARCASGRSTPCGPSALHGLPARRAQLKVTGSIAVGSSTTSGSGSSGATAATAAATTTENGRRVRFITTGIGTPLVRTVRFRAVMRHGSGAAHGAAGSTGSEDRGAEPSRASARVDPLRRAFRASLDFGKCRCAVLRGFRLLDPANPVLRTLILTNRDEQTLIPRHRGHGGLISGAWAESPLIPMHGTTPP